MANREMLEEATEGYESYILDIDCPDKEVLGALELAVRESGHLIVPRHVEAPDSGPFERILPVATTSEELAAQLGQSPNTRLIFATRHLSVAVVGAVYGNAERDPLAPNEDDLYGWEFQGDTPPLIAPWVDLSLYPKPDKDNNEAYVYSPRPEGTLWFVDETEFMEYPGATGLYYRVDHGNQGVEAQGLFSVSDYDIGYLAQAGLVVWCDRPNV